MGSGKSVNIQVQLTEEANDFLDKVTPAAARKIEFVIRRVMSGDKDRTIFKKLEGTEIWEFRILYAGTAYRLFAFWDTDGETLIIATHGIVKKTQRTPAKEIAKAERIRMEYFEEKKRRSKI